MQISLKTKLADAIHNNYLLLPIINRFDIHLGFGDNTVEDVCRSHNVNAQFFIEIVNSFSDNEYFPQDHLQSFPMQLIVDYIVKSHRYYTGIKVPQIETLIMQLLEDSNLQSRKHIELVNNFFKGYKSELTEHIAEEESHVHPYVLKIEKAYSDGLIDESLIKLVKENSIARYANEHNNIEDKLFDLKNIIIKYLPPVANYALSNALLIELFRLERDLNDHARIEDKILVPKVISLENLILKH